MDPLNNSPANWDKAAPTAARQSIRLREFAGAGRIVAGTTLAARAGKITTVLLAAASEAPQAPLELLAQATEQLPPELVRRLQQLTEQDATSASPAALADVATQLADRQAAVVQDLLATARVAADRVLLLAIHDPGIWHCTVDKINGCTGLTDAARIAQQTGINCLDALPARDLAAGGQGGPITSLAEARLLQTRHRSTLLIDLGRTMRATYIPAESLSRGRADKRPRVLGFHVGPGMQLVDALAHKLTGGGQSMDAGGRLAVQGQQIAELLVHWQRDSYFDRPLPRWHPAGVPPERFLTEAYQLAVKSNWSVRDLLCTATHFLAHLVADTALRRLPAGYPVDEVVLSGGGVQNGLLMRQVAARLTTIPLVRMAERGFAAEVFEAAAVAALAMLAIDQQPATQPEITGAAQACVAGRLTPGAATAWRRLVAEMSANATPGLSLRTAS